MNVDDLTFGVRPEARERIVQTRGRPCGIKGWLLDFVWRARPLEVRVLSRIDERIKTFDRFPQSSARHRPQLMRIPFDLLRQFFQRVGAEEVPTFSINDWGLGAPFFSLHRLGVENRPDRSTAIQLV